ncbi:acyltransferase family protein [Pseudoteredinibacter isoporae]|uniref:Peptidoglycan/LPS O-acetylase OafA/YrhL n=1 Tax=Pseudoteredinibacter isoporae TaxID=570281 RepID=A0A7X0JR87_9GAMM|nr:acyltransferase [Pseudoteredinibacter isoporae]MBB6520178.1 peptidoglycan/LPS O-acetylase OafA/YrhL [Pseudoteredinibacter isoporae]NHO85750.1 acyltransferase [Pseudoteredinibacter isoporae]NIB25798.1 acyltransferase [Pseudoteredinibacter isoporae]
MLERNHLQHSMPGLTGLRGIAALMVLLFHCWGEAGFSSLSLPLGDINVRLDPLLSVGWSGVQILFVLSAFLLARPFIRANSSFKRSPVTPSYFLHRASRVFPAYYAQLIILLFVFYALNGDWPFGLDRLYGYVLMLFIPEPIGIGNPILNGVWWTLPIELSFYIVLPFLGPFLKWKNRFYLLFLFVGCMLVWRYYVVSELPTAKVTVWTVQLPGSLDSFGLGIMAALIHVHYYENAQLRTRYLRYLPVAFALALPAYVLLISWMDTDKLLYWKNNLIFFSWTTLFSAVTALVVLACAANLSSARLLFANRYVFYMGLVSYGLYLWHFPVMKWVYQYSPISSMAGDHFLWLTSVTFVFSLLLASLSWFFIESKVINWVKHKTRSAQQENRYDEVLAHKV